MSLPVAPDDAPKYLVEGLAKQSPETLRALATYAEELADQKEADAAAELEANSIDDDELDFDPDEIDRDEAPGKACITIKKPHGKSGYYYFQWREGEQILSEYIRPVSPKE